MVITYYGKQFFKIQLGDLTLVFDPISKESNAKGPKFGADIALISAEHPDLNGREEVEYGDRKPFIISSPGEYEIQNVFIKGFGTKSSYGGSETIGTIYQVSLEGMNICFLGATSEEDLNLKAKEGLDDIDVLFVPVSKTTLSPSSAYKLSVKLEPKIVIPMGYEDDTTLDKFLKEGGEGSEKPQDKIVLKKKDLTDKEGDIVVLNPQSS